ncbi:transposase [Holospora undulata]|uniref:transposase n=1 Tax=Holospora undulata TaxID=1169117 RepID=UPI0003A8DCB7|nr:transposase [Holospora undulata]
MVSLKTLNSAPLKTFFDPLKDAYPKAPIHLILDQQPYNTSKVTQKIEKERGIEVHYLPSPIAHKC